MTQKHSSYMKYPKYLLRALGLGLLFSLAFAGTALATPGKLSQSATEVLVNQPVTFAYEPLPGPVGVDPNLPVHLVWQSDGNASFGFDPAFRRETDCYPLTGQGCFVTYAFSTDRSKIVDVLDGSGQQGDRVGVMVRRPEDLPAPITVLSKKQKGKVVTITVLSPKLRIDAGWRKYPKVGQATARLLGTLPDGRRKFRITLTPPPGQVKVIISAANRGSRGFDIIRFKFTVKKVPKSPQYHSKVAPRAAQLALG